MRCEVARAQVSAATDGELADVDLDSLDAHLARCPGCSRFSARCREVASVLSVEEVDAVPDITSSVLSAVGERPPRPGGRWWGLAAASLFVVAALGGASLAVVLDGDRAVAAADVGARVLRAQHGIESLDAELAVLERGWHPEVPERRFEGRLRYAAPERLELVLEDRTAYPSGAWRPNDVRIVVDDDLRWTTGPRDCPTWAQPDCSPTHPRVQGVQGREPFDEVWPIPIELVAPVGSFLPAAPAGRVEPGTWDGRATVGVQLTVADVSSLVDALRVAGNLRPVHPTDPVELWLDDDTLVPVRLRVHAGAEPERQRWATSRGHVEQPGELVLELRLTGLRINEDPRQQLPRPPSNAQLLDAGFEPGPSPVPSPSTLPEGFTPHRSGVVRGSGPLVGVRSWVDGSAWLKVRATEEWPGGRLFGDPGELVRLVDLGAAGVGYVSEDGRSVAVHGERIDLVVTGSVAPDVLATVASSLGVRGRPVPPHWEEAATRSLGDARAAVVPLLVPGDPEGFGPPGVRVSGRRAVLAYPGASERGFQLAQEPAERLTPPADRDAASVRVRETTGRWSPGRGELEWVERGMAVSVSSQTMTLAELLAIAEDLRPA